ncbi:hypothetical protein [Roseateles chitinivorans]|uniref:hypothetical protein n=1 Tax=Roseateles chitinivorans TaxID=2917965 RepID=UPI003D664532
MDTVILDVVIGLILTYLVLGMLVSKVQEYFVGQLGTSRQHTLHDMLEQTLQGDKGLKEKLLRNPLIFSLFQGNSVEQGAVRAKGPSAIPSDLFARALLIEVYDDGKGSHPKDKYASPRVFVDNLTSDKKQAHTIVGVLRGLLGGNEKDWPGYESAIAQWFDQVGARADGWFQRKASLWSLRLALLLAVVLNVNTFQLAERLSGDPDLRRTAVTLAKRTLDEFGDAKTKEATAPLAAPLAPNKRAEDALQLAHQLLSPIYFKNQKLASFDPNRQALKLDPQLTPIQACARAPAAIGKGTNGSQSALSNPKTWLELLPALRDEAGQLTLPEYVDLSAVAPPSETASEARKAAPPPVRCNAPKSGASAASALLQSSGPDNCTAETGPKSDNRADKKTDNKPLQDQTVSYERRRRDLHACITTLSSWVTTSFGAASADASLSAELKDVERALLDAKNAVREMIGDGGASLLVTRLYLRDPEAFVACTELPGMSRDRLRACVEAGSSGKLSLPVGWTARNIREAFCTIKKGEFDKPAPRSRPRARSSPTKRTPMAARGRSASSPWCCKARRWSVGRRSSISWASASRPSSSPWARRSGSTCWAV